MSTFDDPFDAARALSRSPCVCGRHRSAAEHEQAALTLRCEPVAYQSTSEDKRYEGVVASAVMRAVFPQDAARRAFLKSVGASTALAAVSQFLPLQRAHQLFPPARATSKKVLHDHLHPLTLPHTSPHTSPHT